MLTNKRMQNEYFYSTFHVYACMQRKNRIPDGSAQSFRPMQTDVSAPVTENRVAIEISYGRFLSGGILIVVLAHSLIRNKINYDCAQKHTHMLI